MENLNTKIETKEDLILETPEVSLEPTLEEKSDKNEITDVEKVDKVGNLKESDQNEDSNTSTNLEKESENTNNDKQSEKLNSENINENLNSNKSSHIVKQKEIALESVIETVNSQENKTLTSTEEKEFPLNSNQNDIVFQNQEKEIEKNIEKIENKIEKKIEVDLGNNIEEKIEKNVERKIEKDFQSKIETKIENNLQKKIEDDFKNKIESEIEKNLEIKIEDDFKNEIETKIENQIETLEKVKHIPENNLQSETEEIYSKKSVETNQKEIKNEKEMTRELESNSTSKKNDETLDSIVFKDKDETENSIVFKEEDETQDSIVFKEEDETENSIVFKEEDETENSIVFKEENETENSIVFKEENETQDPIVFKEEDKTQDSIVFKDDDNSGIDFIDDLEPEAEIDDIFHTEKNSQSQIPSLEQKIAFIELDDDFLPDDTEIPPTDIDNINTFEKQERTPGIETVQQQNAPPQQSINPIPQVSNSPGVSYYRNSPSVAAVPKYNPTANNASMSAYQSSYNTGFYANSNAFFAQQQQQPTVKKQEPLKPNKPFFEELPIPKHKHITPTSSTPLTTPTFTYSNPFNNRPTAPFVISPPPHANSSNIHAPPIIPSANVPVPTPPTASYSSSNQVYTGTQDSSYIQNNPAYSSSPLTSSTPTGRYYPQAVAPPPVSSIRSYSSGSSHLSSHANTKPTKSYNSSDNTDPFSPPISILNEAKAIASHHSHPPFHSRAGSVVSNSSDNNNNNNNVLGPINSNTSIHSSYSYSSSNPINASKDTVASQFKNGHQTSQPFQNSSPVNDGFIKPSSEYLPQQPFQSNNSSPNLQKSTIRSQSFSTASQKYKPNTLPMAAAPNISQMPLNGPSALPLKHGSTLENNTNFDNMSNVANVNIPPRKIPVAQDQILQQQGAQPYNAVNLQSFPNVSHVDHQNRQFVSPPPRRDSMYSTTSSYTPGAPEMTSNVNYGSTNAKAGLPKKPIMSSLSASNSPELSKNSLFSSDIKAKPIVSANNLMINPGATIAGASSASISTTSVSSFVDMKTAAGNTPLVLWSWNGKAVTIIPSKVAYSGFGSSDLSIKPISEIITLPSLDSSFPGPLFIPGIRGSSKTKKAAVLKWISSKIEQLEKDLPSLAAADPEFDFKDKLCLWKLMKTFITHDGSLEGDAQITNEVRQILSPKISEITEAAPVLASGLELYSQSSALNLNQISNDSNSEALKLNERIQTIISFLQLGNKDGALKYCIQHNLWAHALIISASLSKEAWKDTIQEFSHTTISSLGNGNEILSVYYEIFGGSGRAALEELGLGNTILPLSTASLTPMHAPLNVPSTGAPILPNTFAGNKLNNENELLNQNKNIETKLSKWRDTLSLIVSNRSPNDIEAINQLGLILKSHKKVYAAHCCFLFTRALSRCGGIFDNNVEFSLLGVESVTNAFDHGFDLDAITLTELYEFGLSLNSTIPNFAGFPHLLLYKYQHAVILADHGYNTVASTYLEKISSSLKSSSSTTNLLYNSQFMQAVNEAYNRISGSPNDEKAGWLQRTFTKPSKVLGQLDKTFVKFVSGEDEVDGPKDSSLDRRFGKIANSNISRVSSAADLTSHSPGISPTANKNIPHAFDRSRSSFALNTNDFSSSGTFTNKAASSINKSGRYTPNFDSNSTLITSQNSLPQKYPLRTRKSFPILGTSSTDANMHANRYTPALQKTKEYPIIESEDASVPLPNSEPNLSQESSKLESVPPNISKPTKDPYGVDGLLNFSAPSGRANKVVRNEYEKNPEEPSLKNIDGFVSNKPSMVSQDTPKPAGYGKKSSIKNRYAPGNSTSKYAPASSSNNLQGSTEYPTTKADLSVDGANFAEKSKLSYESSPKDSYVDYSKYDESEDHFIPREGKQNENTKDNGFNDKSPNDGKSYNEMKNEHSLNVEEEESFNNEKDTTEEEEYNEPDNSFDYQPPVMHDPFADYFGASSEVDTSPQNPEEFVSPMDSPQQLVPVFELPNTDTDESKLETFTPASVLGPPKFNSITSNSTKNNEKFNSDRFARKEENETEDEEIEDLGLSNSKKKDKYDEDSESKDKNKGKKQESSSGNGNNENDGGKGKGWFSWLGRAEKKNEPKVYKAKLGNESKFHYDEKLKKWVNSDVKDDGKGNEPPPPPPRSQLKGSQGKTPSSSLKSTKEKSDKPLSSQEDGMVKSMSGLSLDNKKPPSISPNSTISSKPPMSGKSSIKSQTNDTLSDLLSIAPASGSKKSTRRSTKNRYVDIIGQQK